MTASLRFWAKGSLVAGTVLGLALGGCKAKAPATDDSSLATQVQSRLASDSALSGQPIQSSVSGGVATLNGSVTSDAARALAGNDAAQVAGVRTVMNNLTVQATESVPAATVSTPEPTPMPVVKSAKPTAMVSRMSSAPAPIERSAPAPAMQQSAPPPPAMSQAAPPAPPAPPAPVIHNVTLAAGTSIPVRITQTLDSATTQTGDKFTGVVASDVVSDGMVVLPQGTAVTGRVDEAKDAAHFKGSSLLSISLTSINRRGERLDVATEPFAKEGEGRGKNTAEKIGGGAAVGAILGGILGGGKGAAIGATAGGGVGAGANTITRGQQVQIPSESLVRFKLANSVMVKVTTGGSDERDGAGLERRP